MSEFDNTIYIDSVKSKVKVEKKNCSNLKDSLNEIFISDEKEKTVYDEMKNQMNVIATNGEKSSKRLASIYKYFQNELKKIYETSQALRKEEDAYTGFLDEFEHSSKDMENKLNALIELQEKRDKAIRREAINSNVGNNTLSYNTNITNKKSELNECLFAFESNKEKDIHEFFKKYILSVLKYHCQCAQILSSSFNYISQEFPEIDIENFAVGRDNDEDKYNFIKTTCKIDIEELKNKEEQIQNLKDEDKRTHQDNVYKDD